MNRAFLTVPPDVSALDDASRDAFGDPRDRGSIADVPFAELFGMAHRRKWRGALVLRKSEIKKIVYFEDGTPICVKSNLVEECLGHVLVRERLISETECETSIARLKEKKRRQGEILVEMGSISAHNLAFALERQLETKLFDLFSWLEGQYLFQAGLEPEFRVVLATPPVEVIALGIRQGMSSDRIRRELGKWDPHAPFAAREAQILLSVPGMTSVAEPLARAIASEWTLSRILEQPVCQTDAGLALLYGLLVAALIEPTPASPLPKTPDEAERMHEVLAAQNAYERLGLVHDATVEAIARAFQQRAENFDPTKKVADYPRAFREWLERIWILYRDARDLLLDTQARAQLDQELSQHDAPKIPLVLAEAAFNAGLLHSQNAEWPAARAAFFEAVQWLPDEPAYRAHLHWATSAETGHDAAKVAESLLALEGLCADHPDSKEALLFIGQLHERLGDRQSAKDAYAKVLKLDPDSAIARAFFESEPR